MHIRILGATLCLCLSTPLTSCDRRNNPVYIEPRDTSETFWQYAVKIVTSLSSQRMTFAGLDAIGTVEIPTSPEVKWTPVEPSAIAQCMKASEQVAEKTREVHKRFPALKCSTRTLAAVYESETDTLVRVVENGNQFPKIILYKHASTLALESKQQ